MKVKELFSEPKFPIHLYNEQGEEIFVANTEVEADVELDDLFREVNYPIRIFNVQGKEIYEEDIDGYWCKKEYHEQGVFKYISKNSKKKSIMKRFYQMFKRFLTN